MTTTRALVAGYLAAIVVANLTLAHWGPRAAIWNAVALIGFDLVSRDRLHDAWAGHVRRNMALLITAGSLLSFAAGVLLGSGSHIGRIALASGVAFACAGATDALVYQWRRAQPWADRSNESNVAAAAVDSLVFALLLPYPFSWAFVLTLWATKVAGGYVWSLILRRRRRVEAAAC